MGATRRTPSLVRASTPKFLAIAICAKAIVEACISKSTTGTNVRGKVAGVVTRRDVVIGEVASRYTSLGKAANRCQAKY